ncbi:hypothetical protein CYMTET_26536, partial [Cymbomonas tetramitiformis]
MARRFNEIGISRLKLQVALCTFLILLTITLFVQSFLSTASSPSRESHIPLQSPGKDYFDSSSAPADADDDAVGQAEEKIATDLRYQAIAFSSVAEHRGEEETTPENTLVTAGKVGYLDTSSDSKLASRDDAVGQAGEKTATDLRYQEIAFSSVAEHRGEEETTPENTPVTAGMVGYLDTSSDSKLASRTASNLDPPTVLPSMRQITKPSAPANVSSSFSLKRAPSLFPRPKLRPSIASRPRSSSRTDAVESSKPKIPSNSDATAAGKASVVRPKPSAKPKPVRPRAKDERVEGGPCGGAPPNLLPFDLYDSPFWDPETKKPIRKPTRNFPRPSPPPPSNPVSPPSPPLGPVVVGSHGVGDTSEVDTHEEHFGRRRLQHITEKWHYSTAGCSDKKVLHENDGVGTIVKKAVKQAEVGLQ